MSDRDHKIIDSHRKMNEIGGFLMGIGIGLFLAKSLGANPILNPVRILSLLAGFTLLVIEQRKWNKYKNKNRD